MNTGNAAKELLEKCRRIDERIKGKMSELHLAREQASRVTACYSEQPRGGSTNHSRVETGVIKIIELEHQINAEIDALIEHRKLATRIIGLIDNDRYRDLLTWRYFSLWNWDRIAEAFGCDRLQVWRIHGRALLEANRVIADVYE